MDADETRVVCLLCNESDETCEGLLSHMKVRKRMFSDQNSYLLTLLWIRRSNRCFVSNICVDRISNVMPEALSRCHCSAREFLLIC